MYLQLGRLPITTMRHWTPTLNPLCSAKLDVLAVYLLYHSVCDVQVQSSGDSSEHGRVLTEDRNNLEFEEFFPLRGTSRLSARNLVEGLHDMLPADDVPVDVLSWYHGISCPSSTIFSSMSGMRSITASILLSLGTGLFFSGSAYIFGFFRIEPNPLYVVYT
jgi:hypothetical protein